VPLTLEQIVENGLCIGCGLCRSIAGPERVDLVMTPEGRERPVARQALSASTLARINAICPGTRIGGADPAACTDTAVHDTIWGSAERLSIGYATDPVVRYRGSTGGVLTALGQFLLASGRVRFILHVGASRSAPMRSERRLSFDAGSVLEEAGSRCERPPVPRHDVLRTAASVTPDRPAT
jgi:coenzyme F420 hydrogenase subunit beta